MNSTLNASCLNFTNCSDVAVFYQASGVLHILLVVIPVLVIGPIVLAIFISNKKLRDPISVLHICTAIICIIGPLTYGLLMDFSLITTVEVFGLCDSKNPRTFWILFGTFQSLLLATNSILSSVQYVTIKWGKQKVSTPCVLGIFFALLVIIFLANLIHLIGLTKEEHIRGSLCRHPGSEVPYAYPLITMFSFGVFTIPPFALVVIFSIWTIIHIKKNTVDNGHSVRNVLKIVLLWTSSIIFLRFLPIFVIFLGFDTVNAPIAIVVVRSWYGIYSIELANPLFLILTLFLHKTVRQTFLKKTKKMFGFKKVNKIASSILPLSKSSPPGLPLSESSPPVLIFVTSLESYSE